MTCREGIALATEWICTRIILKLDCSTIIAAMGLKGVHRSRLCFILDEITENRSCLPEVKLQAIRWEQNRAAHELAQLAKNTAMWRVSSPCCIDQVIAQECNNSR
ncbi:hypothetical protein PR202_gb07993 [Eleusine coracana subsp. coracana]|uniref:RNase H type-1 domain-containing protein n=1 Tax=Eleusine coracana subsp. coracana TaxID=191504 RepID=A0AAV5ECT5_ELECO|nr:hypothetical protein PR202_gb07993 [Eleusine coracana subsp. coracana]